MLHEAFLEGNKPVPAHISELKYPLILVRAGFAGVPTHAKKSGLKAKRRAGHGKPRGVLPGEDHRKARLPGAVATGKVRSGVRMMVSGKGPCTGNVPESGRMALVIPAGFEPATLRLGI